MTKRSISNYRPSITSPAQELFNSSILPKTSLIIGQNVGHPKIEPGSFEEDLSGSFNNALRSLPKKEGSRKSKESTNSQCRTSKNHNFQKHTVVTINKLASNIAKGLGKSLVESTARQMWNIYLSSGIKSKKILVILFGRANLRQEKYKELLKNAFFGEFCNYDQAIVREAQDLLRQKLLEVLTEESIRTNIFQSRQIKHKQQFLSYFLEFVELLRTGPLVKFRISAISSRRIINRAQTSTCLTEHNIRQR